jgi:hypothetical protein
MARRVLAATLASLVVSLGAGACNKSEPGGAGVDSPGGSVAGTESTATGTRAGAGAEVEEGGGGRGLARSLVAVTGTSLGDASPCERTCGRIGDCLFESDDYREPEAGGLELECLDLCVHTPKDAEPHQALLKCEQRSSCGELIECAEASWAALGELREGPTVEGFTATVDPCKAGCRWLYSCMFSSAPPGDAYMDPAIEEQVRYCERSCENMEPQERETYINLGRCLPSHCSSGDSTCFDYGY